MAEIRLAKIPAWYVKGLVASKAEAEEWALWCEVKEESGAWRKFRDTDDMDEHFESWLDVANMGSDMVGHNLDFVQGFKFNRVRSDFDGVSPLQLDPLFHAVMANGYATLHELRTVYSLEDVYLMVDSITTTKRNEQLAIDSARNAQ